MSGIKFYRDKDLPFFELKVCGTSDLSYKKHAHEEYSFGIVDQGESSAWYGGGSTRVYPNTLVLFPPDLIHACNPVQQNCWQYKMLFVNAKWVQSFLKSKGSNLDTPVIRYDPGYAVFSAVSRMMENLRGDSGPLEKEAGVLAVFEQIAGNEPGARYSGYRQEKPQLKIIKEYLHSCFLEKVTLDELEKVSGINKFHIIHLFKEAFKIPPHTYQTLLRINYAKKELRKHRGIIEVAMEAGFYDQSHFTKVFKGQVGVTPERYQRLN